MTVLTFDTDWMRDVDMCKFIDEYSELPRSTFFLHEHTGSWRPKFHEHGPHPSIPTSGDVAALAMTAPESGQVGLRSHSCVTSHMLSVKWAEQGFLYQSNECRLFATSAEPYRTSWGIWEAPICYMDNMDLWYPQNWPRKNHKPLSSVVVERALGSQGTFMLDLHPLHIALNTVDVDDYVAKREKLNTTGCSPWSLATGEWGVRSLFELLLSRIDSDRAESVSVQGAIGLAQQLP